MKTATHSEREKFVADLIRHAPEATAWHASRLMRYSGTYHRLKAKRLEAILTAREIRKLAEIEQRITELCAEMHCTPVFGVIGGAETFNVVMPDEYAVWVPAI